MGELTGFSGGCQCGAVRYRIEGGLRYPHLCHCRMCQKASGNYFMPLAASTLTQFEMTRGEASWFQSSDHVRRGFCGRCGTPLFYDMPGADFINITLGSLDEPQRIRPEAQSNLASKMHWFSELDRLPVEPEPATDDAPAPVNGRQHPDQDTAKWPPEDSDP
ncbi:GFA family protein [Agrobacterium genomosp. 3 str. CIP 111-78]|uniref:GFA family protein n=1 Tax=Agrobacterium tumefaciens TaxID=358 RepID=A0AAE6EJ30_AGRTU|nr:MULTISPECIES: GFA family protein [Agrobacterium tumefaciens complex]MCA2373876.1 GFA family protein [Agrobacterium tomkonis CIP 111-78]QCL99356.1 GFA family protein [Agrobacterium tumefaciens]